MTSPRFTRPLPLDVVPADQVGDLIESADREFVGLERELEERTAEADELETSAKAMGVDPDGSSWGLIQLQRFLEELRHETRRDATASVEVARRRAELRLVEAHEDAERVRSGAPPSPAPSPAKRTTGLLADHTPNGTGAAATAPPVEPWLVRDATAVITEEEAPDAHGASPPLASVLPIEPEPLTMVPLVEPAPGDTYNNGVGPTAPPDVSLGLVADPPQSPPELPPTLLPAPQPNAYDTVFWSDQGEGNARVEAPPPPPAATSEPPPADLSEPVPKRPRKSRRFRRIPVSAILEVVAVLLILVFILLRLS
jgi:hypothetical protein